MNEKDTLSNDFSSNHQKMWMKCRNSSVNLFFKEGGRGVTFFKGGKRPKKCRKFDSQKE